MAWCVATFAFPFAAVAEDKHREATDPCGGPQELLNKVGTTPCVVVFGEAVFNVSYGNVTADGNASESNYTISLKGQIVGYPQTNIAVGISPSSQISVTLPSYVRVSSMRFGVLAGGASDMQFSYRQLVAASEKTGLMTGFQLLLDSPTGSAPLRAPGPSYTGQFLFSQSLPRNFGISGSLGLQNAQSSWAFSPMLSPSWQSPGGTNLSATVSHSFNPNYTPLSFSVEQLLGRHAMFVLSYGDAGASRTASAPVANISIPITESLRAFSWGVFYLLGRSDAPT